MEKFKYEKYVIEKNKTDMLSSLKLIDKKLIEESIEEFEVENISDLANYLVQEFEDVLNMAKNDIFTQMFFKRLVENENTPIFSAYESDVESFYVFVYKNGDYYSYYIPDEIRKIIKKLLKI